MSNVQPLEVVDRASETLLQVGDNLDKIRERVNFIFNFIEPNIRVFNIFITPMIKST